MGRRVVTVFGGTGFIGRHVVRRLAGTGAIIRVAVRHEEDVRFLKPMGDVGQIVARKTDITDPEDIEKAVAGAAWVVNLVGIFHPRGQHTFETVHARAPGEVAAAAKRAGAVRMVHLSALGASGASGSAYGRSKAKGEKAVLGAFPRATILRPSVVFGPEDRFFNMFARMALFSPFLPVIDRKAWSFGHPGLFGFGGPRFQPVYVGDVADAVVAALAGERFCGGTYELGGPHVYTMRQIMELTLKTTGRKRCLLPLTFGMARVQAALMSLMPEPLLTPDQVRMMLQDNVLSGECPGFDAFGLEPTTAEAILPTYLELFRKTHRQFILR